MKTIAVIPARGGSKRIPGKNKKDFLGKPIISYAIRSAINSELFDMVIVSTDDPEIAEISKKYGAEVPFMRSEKNSDDHSTLVDVITEVDQAFLAKSIDLKTICCILPTAVLSTSEDLKRSFDHFNKRSYDIVLPVVNFGYPIQRSLQVTDNQKVEFVSPEFLTSRSQDLEKRYHDAGQYYWMNVDSFREKRQFFTDNTGAIIVDELHVQDVDTETDWKLAELKFKLIKGEQ